jgi:hypothetical protein
MKVFWYQGGLHFEPEGEFDMAKLKQMSKEYGVPTSAPAVAPRVNAGHKFSGSAEDLWDAITGNPKAPR